ncbi:Nadp-Dependent Oxidoreductase Domain-Containing Protein 1 [Manis pentadactyla]|nr:Nadp-Dependent Oxidoreductase Domain-Containing Protein 1 [Manis pentadactyla]
MAVWRREEKQSSGHASRMPTTMRISCSTGSLNNSSKPLPIKVKSYGGGHFALQLCIRMPGRRTLKLGEI